MNSAPVQIGPYRLVAEIGHGEIGLIYRATDTLYERTVALKVLRAHVAQDMVLARHFVSAGREAMRLRHPNIVRVYDAGQADGLFYVAMDLMDGETLETGLAQSPQAWDGAETLQVVEQVGTALEYAHRRGLVHHNLKPSNIFVGGDGHVRVSDFDGIAARAGESGHPLYYRLKSPLFLAPEQARGDEQVDAAADIYSLAAIAYRLITGRPPVGGGNPLNLLWRIADEESKRADEVLPSVSTSVADALAAALTKDPSQRLAQVSELLRGLRGAPLPPRKVKPPQARKTPAAPTAAPDVLPAVITHPEPSNITSTPKSSPSKPPVPPAPIPHVPTIAYEPPGTYSSALADDKEEDGVEHDDPGRDTAFVQPPPIVALWQRATRTARRAEPMALPALALLAVGGLAALLLIFAAMRVAGTLIARMADDDARNAGQIIVILPTVTPTPQLVADGGARDLDATDEGNLQRVGEKVGASDGASDGAANGVDDVPPSPRVVGGGVQMAVVVTSTAALPPSATPAATATAAATATPSRTPTPSATPTETATPLPTATPSPVPTNTPTVTPTPTRTPVPTAEALGGRLAYTLWNPNIDRPEVWVWDLSRRINNPPLTNFRQPDFSPQGNLVANAYGDGGLDNLVKMGVFGEGAQIISAYAEDGHPHWSADGKTVVFDSALMGDRQFRLYLQEDLSQSNERPPIMYAGFEIFGRYPIFLGDGRIAYNGCNYWQNGSTCGVWVLSPDGAQPTNATGWPGDIPTDNLGSRILFMSDRAGSWDVYSMNPDGSNLLQLTDLPGVEGLATASPDGNNIAYLTNQDGVWSFYVMQPDGGNVRKLMDVPGNFGRGDYDWFYERISWGR